MNLEIEIHIIQIRGVWLAYYSRPSTCLAVPVSSYHVTMTSHCSRAGKPYSLQQQTVVSTELYNLLPTLRNIGCGILQLDETNISMPAEPIY